MRNAKTLKATAITACATLFALSLSACATTIKTEEAKEDGKLTIVATTGYLGDAAKNIAPDAEITVLVGPGGDPHTQPLTTQDIEKLNDADVVLWTSHDMEHQMRDQLEKLGDKQVAAGEAIPEADLLPWEEDGKIEGHDPHVWNSPDNWKHVVTASAEKIAEIDSANAKVYMENADKYNKMIDEAKAAAKVELDKIPAERRVLITGHDAFNYLGKTFGIEIHATDFVSSEAQITAADLDELATLIADKKVPTIFQDNLANPEAIKHLKEAVKSKGWEVEISDKELYADSLGEAAPVDTYLGVFEYNTKAIVEALTAK
ncbi:ABC transporter, substrate-binding protein [Gleimia coleocanis DSM 15436]|uniref:ABC transporter, substrate-binding protein n=1 Tax=Gleimia coleocanis DSM 15436 TaxID=525245 RepID=C0VY72_9ACTO|nr:metal ABC transporter substrate-binding protein [Gleimia coleocanis]EEH64375.1 ABC transporter, substrate-binding protein [Gleimia coleocanis DSM 15436]